MKYLSLMFTVLFFACSPEKPLQDVLEEVRVAYKKAGATGDLEKFKSLNSSYRWSQTHNALASWGSKLAAKDIKRLVRSAPKSDEVEFFELIQKGDTAGLVQRWKKVSTNGRGDSFVSYCFTKFVKEDGQWKVDAGGYRLGEKLYVVDGKFSTKNFPEDFHVDGVVRKGLALKKPVEIVGKLETTIYGFDIELLVNDEKVKVSKDTSSFKVIPNGLKKGKNTVKVSLKATASRKAEKVELSIKTKSNKVLIDLKGKLKEGENTFEFTAE